MSQQVGKQREPQLSGPKADKPVRPLAGYLIAGAALAALFGLAVLKGRVPQTPEEKRG